MYRILHDRGFVIHLAVYTAVNFLLLAINLFTDPEQLWFYWPMLGWGLGLLGHGFAVRRASSAVSAFGAKQAITTMSATEVQEHARRLWEAHGAGAIAEAAHKAQSFETAGDLVQARTWRRIEAALAQMSGPRES